MCVPGRYENNIPAANGKYKLDLLIGVENGLALDIVICVTSYLLPRAEM